MKEALIKLKPSLLFLSIAIFSLLVGFLTKDKVIDINFHDTYLVIGHLYVAVLLFLFTVLIGLMYLGLEKIKRPIKLTTGYWHFGFFIASLLILFPAMGLQTSANWAYFTSLMPLISMVLFSTSLIIFGFGLAKAIFGKSIHQDGE